MLRISSNERDRGKQYSMTTYRDEALAYTEGSDPLALKRVPVVGLMFWFEDISEKGFIGGHV